MNAKQSKLIRYFVKHTGDIKLGAQFQVAWPTLTASQKGKATTWMKKVIVTMMAVKDQKTKWEEQKKLSQQLVNLEILKGF